MGVSALTEIIICDVSIGGSKYGMSLGRSRGASDGKILGSDI